MRDGGRLSRCSATDAGCRRSGRVGAWVERTWKSGGHPSFRCCAVIRRTSGSCGLFELFVPSIIRLSSTGQPGLHQAYKHLIYSLTGNERSRLSWRGFRVFQLRWQGTEVMDSRTHLSSSPPPPLPACWLLSSGLDKSVYERSIGGKVPFCFILLLSVLSRSKPGWQFAFCCVVLKTWQTDVCGRASAARAWQVWPSHSSRLGLVFLSMNVKGKKKSTFGRTAFGRNKVLYISFSKVNECLKPFLILLCIYPALF